MPNTSQTTKKQTTSDPEPRVHKPVDGGSEGIGAEQDPGKNAPQPAKGPHGQPGSTAPQTNRGERDVRSTDTTGGAQGARSGQDRQLGPQEPQKPDVIGPTQAGHIGQGGPINTEPGPETLRREARARGEHATHDGEAPILVGREGDTFRTVRLLDGENSGSEFRVAEPIPQVLVANGRRFLISNREEGTYTWQVP